LETVRVGFAVQRGGGATAGLGATAAAKGSRHRPGEHLLRGDGLLKARAGTSMPRDADSQGGRRDSYGLADFFALLVAGTLAGSLTLGRVAIAVAPRITGNKIAATTASVVGAVAMEPTIGGAIAAPPAAAVTVAIACGAYSGAVRRL
jgi:hypothetical protein